jgi:hypothetical protein
MVSRNTEQNLSKRRKIIKKRTRGYSMVSRNTEQNLSKRRKIIKNGARMPNLCISKIETPLKQAGENASASIRS